MQFDSLSLTTRAHAVDLLFRLPAVELSVREKREIHSKTDSITSVFNFIIKSHNKDDTTTRSGAEADSTQRQSLVCFMASFR